FPGFLNVIVRLHGNLLMGRAGRVYVGWLGLAVLVLGISGLILWWPRRQRWRAAFLVKRGARGLRLYRDLHGAIGIWTFVVFITVSFSGVCLAFPPPRSFLPGSAWFILGRVSAGCGASSSACPACCRRSSLIPVS